MPSQDLRFLEDFAVGYTFATPLRPLDPEVALAFAKQWDPQPFHTDEVEAARHPLFRSLVASGYFTLAFIQRLVFDHVDRFAWGLIGHGIDAIRFRRPVKLKDSLAVRGRLVEVSHRPGSPTGLALFELEATNQNAEVVLTMRVKTVIPSRAVLVGMDAVE